MKKLKSAVLLLLCLFLLSSCLPRVRLDYEEDKRIGREETILELPFRTYSYRITGKLEGESLDAKAAAKVKTELCEKHSNETAVLYTLKGEYTVSVVETYGRSGDYIYFEATKNGWEYISLVFNKKTGLTKEFIEAPVSNMLIPPSSAELGFLLRDSEIAAVNLTEAQVNEKDSWPMENSTKFFYTGGEIFYKKVSKLTMVDQWVMQIEIGTFLTKDSKVPELTAYYLYDTGKKSITGPF
ncbi:MAG: hypothetical protein LBS74_00750 [Oscillospiraceae bacterium]|jgi:hypothetical protein|nr:hypothetical protein [Oscillospiraceae bacterium]